MGSEILPLGLRATLPLQHAEFPREGQDTVPKSPSVSALASHSHTLQRSGRFPRLGGNSPATPTRILSQVPAPSAFALCSILGGLLSCGKLRRLGLPPGSANSDVCRTLKSCFSVWDTAEIYSCTYL